MAIGCIRESQCLTYRRKSSATPLRVAARMPSFAVGRAQALLLCLVGLKKAGAIPDLPMFFSTVRWP